MSVLAGRPPIIGVMGGGRADGSVLDDACRLGGLIARNGWYLLNGGRDAGVMSASARGAAEQGGLTIGVLPGHDRSDVSPYISIPILTGMGSARNSINVLSCDVVVVCPGGSGTLSEIALALKHRKPLITMGFFLESTAGIDLDTTFLFSADGPEAVIALIKELI